MPDVRPKVSVCVVAYNHARYIDACLASAVGQEVDADLEILVGDDHSTDDTARIIGRHAEARPDLIRPVFHERNVGGSQNYRDLIGLASGSYIAHLDGDDYWLPGKLAEQIAFLERHTDCVAAYTNAIVISDDGRQVARFNGAVPELFDLDFLVRAGNFLNGSSLMYRARCKTPILQLQGDTLDYHYHVLLAGQGRLGYLNRDLTAYRRRSATSTLSNNYELVLEPYWKAILGAQSLGAGSGALRGCVQVLYQRIFRFAIARGRLQDALRWGRRITRECPQATWGLLAASVAAIPFSVGGRMLRRLARRLLGRGPDILYER